MAKRVQDVPSDRLGDASFGTLGASEEPWTEDDGICISETGEREFGETLGSMYG